MTEFSASKKCHLLLLIGDFSGNAVVIILAGPNKTQFLLSSLFFLNSETAAFQIKSKRDSDFFCKYSFPYILIYD